MMETFEQAQVSFVSVTQQFNTATSMGRLMLNVLLSFAQFEREIISERTRDKIAATRRKGKWAGGHPLLGYDVDPHGVQAGGQPAEAEQVRAIFALYLRARGAPAGGRRSSARRGWANKRWQTRKGGERGGKPFTRTSLYQLLTNVVYVGQGPLQGRGPRRRAPGHRRAAVFEQVQAPPAAQRRTGGAAVRNQFGALLKGLLRCGPAAAP